MILIYIDKSSRVQSGGLCTLYTKPPLSVSWSMKRDNRSCFVMIESLEMSGHHLRIGLSCIARRLKDTTGLCSEHGN